MADKRDYYDVLGVSTVSYTHLLSMGLQAWQDRLLKKLGRIHTADEFETNFLQARDAGFKNINVDIMFARPAQSLDDWQETLEKVMKLRPEHISAYSIITVSYTNLEKI